MTKPKPPTMSQAIAAAKKKIKIALEELESAKGPLIETKALTLAQVAKDTGTRLEPQIYVLALLERMTQNKIAELVTRRGTRTRPTTISRALYAKKQTMQPKRVQTLAKVYLDVMASKHSNDKPLDIVPSKDFANRGRKGK